MSFRTWTYGLAMCLLAGCGANPAAMTSSESNVDNRTGTSTDSSSDATAAVPKAPEARSVDCSGTVLHGDHATCDQADIDVADGKVPTVEHPAPAPIKVEVASTATSTETATATATTSSTTTTSSTSSSTATSTSTSTMPAKDPNIVEFHIKAGTGSGSYNTAATPVTAKVGQTLRFINDDTITHRFHTGGAPCPHQPNNTPPGATFDCVLTKAIDASSGGPQEGAVYDHIAGPSSVFFLKVTK